MSEPRSETPRWVRWLVGVFIVWQLVFLVTSNLANFLEEDGRLNDRQSASVQAMLNLQRGMQAWSHATLQREYWGVFRSPPTQSVFPAVEVTWSEPYQGQTTLLLRSFEEPDDPTRFLMLNPLNDRLHNYETWLPFADWEKRAAIGDAVQREEALRELIHEWRRPLWAYMQWRIEPYRLSHPNMPAPAEVVLLWHVYLAPTPSEDGPPSGPIRRDLVRWQASRQVDPNDVRLEVYDPPAKRYFEAKSQR